MWIALLLITHVTCEWVEISQQHYRKPVRKNYHPTTESTEIYANETINANIWTQQHIEVSSDKSVFHAEIGQNAFTYEAIPERSDPVYKDTFGTVERVTNVGKVKRVQLASTPVKSPTIGSSAHLKQIYTNHDESDEYRRLSTSDFRYSASTEANLFTTSVSKTPFKNYSLIKEEESNYFVTGNTKITKEGNFNTHHDHFDHGPKIKINKIAHIEPVKKPDTNRILETLTTDDTSKINFDSKIHHYATSEKPFTITEQTKSEHGNNRKANTTVKILQNDKSDEKYEEADTTATLSEETVTPNTKANTMEILLKIMRTVADTISKNSHKSLNSKVKYLHELKNTLLGNIETRIDSIWPDDTDLQNGKRRRLRFARDAARGHVEFPSSESALMTISFLTFAVFLIKLVLQVIHTYKNKTMMVAAPLVVATAGRAAAAVHRLRNHDKN